VQYDKDRTSVTQCAAWSPDGKRFAVRMRRANVMIADAETEGSCFRCCRAGRSELTGLES